MSNKRIVLTVTIVLVVILFISLKILNAEVTDNNFINFNSTILPKDVIDVYFPFGSLYRIPEEEKISDYLQKANDYEKTGDFHKAYRYYTYAYQRVKGSPAAPYILFKRAYTVENQNIFINELKNILKNYPDFPFKDAVNFDLSLILYLENSIDEADYYLERTIHENDSPFLPYSLTLKGSICLKKEEIDNAIQYFFESISKLKNIISDNRYEQQLMNNYIGLALSYFKNTNFKISEMILRKIYGTSDIINIREKALYYLYKLYLESDRSDLAELCYAIFSRDFPESLYIINMKKEIKKNINNSNKNHIGQNGIKGYGDIGIKDIAILRGINNIDKLVKINYRPFSTQKSNNINSLNAGFSIQIGSFKLEKNAERLMKKLSSYNYPLYVKKIGSDNNFFYRVRVGPFKTRRKAIDVLEELKKYGFKGYLVEE